MRIFLTGADGFIGSCLLNELIHRKYKVAIILKSSHNIKRIHHLIKNCLVFYGDLYDFDFSCKGLDEFKPNIFIHLAWDKVPNRFHNQITQIQNNLKLAKKIFSACLTLKITTLISVGSQSEYGYSNDDIDENTLPYPTTFYGVAKLSVYHFFNVLCSQHGIRFVWHRIFTCYGPSDDTHRFIPMVILMLLQKKTPRLTEGSQLEDFIFVQDVANAIVAALECDQAQGLFNLASGQSYRIKAIAQLIRDRIDPSLKLGFGQVPFRRDQVMKLQASSQKLRTVTGWKPLISLYDGIGQTIDWYAHKLNLSHIEDV